MAKIFDVQDWLKNHPNRNNFDLTHKVHGSYKMGTLYPIMCKPVVPTDSFKIDTAVSLRFTPMPFPTQSNMRVIFHYFYVRTKNIWKNFPNWLQGLEEHTPPYINKPSSFYRDGSLADYLDIPTSFHVNSAEVEEPAILNFGLPSKPISSEVNSSFFFVVPFNFGSAPLLNSPYLFTQCVLYNSIYQNNPCYLSFPIRRSDDSDFVFNSPIESFTDTLSSSSSYASFGIGAPYDDVRIIYVDGDNIVRAYSQLRYESGKFTSSSFVSSSDFDMFKNPCYAYVIFLCTPSLDPPTLLLPVLSPYSLYGPFNVKYRRSAVSSQIGDSGVACPYYGTNANVTENSIKISALPFRAYESIYNAFYRNSQGVQPFVVDGQTKYNKYVTTDEDGADSTDYTLMKRNWELDAYTSCLISPQQGNVPYVGITEVSALGRMSVETPEGETASVRLMDNGEGVEISNLHGETQEARAYALRAASSGFTIPEFREANALQRFLEMNIRKGYKYIDFIEGHFGKKPTYAEMDMPEFIGGFSQRISVNEISNTNGVSTDTLGAIAGQARAIGGSKHGINHYFDDFGFVVGIMCIVPDNAYDCVLPKHYNLLNPLDMYFPEFSKLSYMPLTHEELAPIQTINDPRGSSYRNLSKVFGYQRPNHDLVWYPDTVHGLFRDATGIGNSVICRRFASRPDLGDNFLTIKPEETDTIFNYMFGDQDVALGEIVLDIKAKRPVPRLVVPQIS